MKMQQSILFLPFLQIPSGHHHVANALMDEIVRNYPQMCCDKVDILEYSYGKIEQLVSKIYLTWIQAFPTIYNVIYKHSVYTNIGQNKRYRLYEYLFVYFMKRLIQEKQPSLIICTHALPAYMLNYLKRRNELNAPVINVYTDYFIHCFWGIEHIDYHFVPSHQMKGYLMERGVEEERIFITGIPIHSKIQKQNHLMATDNKSSFSVLVAGGNLGVGGLKEVIEKIESKPSESKIKFYVLCGKNKKLYEKLKKLSNSDIIPLPYIESKGKMNAIYDRMDAIITKPGGVTVSESLFKRKPIFIYDALPGQEEINLQRLKELGVVHLLKKDRICDQLLSILQDKNELKVFEENLSYFHSHLHEKEPSEIIGEILMNQNKVGKGEFRCVT